MRTLCGRNSLAMRVASFHRDALWYACTPRCGRDVGDIWGRCMGDIW